MLISQDGVGERKAKWCIVCKSHMLVDCSFTSQSVGKDPFMHHTLFAVDVQLYRYFSCVSLYPLWRMNFNVCCWPMRFSIFQYLWLSLCRSFFFFCCFLDHIFSLSLSLHSVFSLTHSLTHFRSIRIWLLNVRSLIVLFKQISLPNSIHSHRQTDCIWI